MTTHELKDSPPALAFVGWSGSGKTTLLEQLLAVLAGRGYRVGLLKHTHHRELETDLPGTDTRRLWEAGAAHTALWAPDQLVHIRRCAEAPSLAEALAGFHDVDFVIVEGYKGGGIPKIEVLRAACDTRPIPGLEGRVAWVSDMLDLPDAGPIFGFAEVERLADFVTRQLEGPALDSNRAVSSSIREPSLSGMGRWQEVDHTADLALHVWGRTLEELFIAAARGMFALLVDLESVELEVQHDVVLSALDRETLLVDWLNELLYLGERAPLSAYVGFDFAVLQPTCLEATVKGGTVADYRTHIKAATFHNLKVQRTREGYETELVFDT